MQHVKPNERETAIANERFGEVQEQNTDLLRERRVCADALAAYRLELHGAWEQEKLKLQMELREVEQRIIEIFKNPTPEHFGLENDEYGKGYMAAIAAIADEASVSFKDVALRIADRRFREEEIAFISLRNTRHGEPTCRVLRIRDDGTSAAGEGRTLDVAIADLKRAPKPEL